MRPVHVALLLSLLLHGFLLMAAPWRPPLLTGTGSGVLIPLRIVKEAEGTGGALARCRKGAAPRPAVARRRRAGKRRVLSPVAKRMKAHSEERRNVRPLPSDAGNLIREKEQDPVPLAAAAGEYHIAGRSAPAARRGEEGVPDAYRTLILERIAGEKRYPFRARRRRIEGDVILRFLLLPDGGVREEGAAPGSTGGRILRDAALTSLRRAAPFPPPPPGCRREGGLPMEVRIRYRLKNNP
ncbi:MAG: TonB family protein [Deltaproteobacteria bacterium]|nr:TonB family protein [Deltaproteobacteria bacterium]